MKAEFGEVERNLARSERLVREAFEQGADWVILPEFFTSAIAFHPKMLDAVRPSDGKPLELLVSLAREYEGVVGGSFLALRDGSSYNMFALAFPDGQTVFHDKDEPTLWENSYYIGGNDDGVVETPVGPVGVALCAEMFRTRTARRMLRRVGLVLTGSCWWTVPGDAPEGAERVDRANRALLRLAPQKMAQMLGVPVVHASHSGSFEGLTLSDEPRPYRSHYLGETQIVDGTGRVLARMNYEDGEGVIVAEVQSGLMWSPRASVPDDIWIRALPLWFVEKWRREAQLGAEYYRTTTVPYLARMATSRTPR